MKYILRSKLSTLHTASARDKGLYPNVVDKLPEGEKPC